MDSLQEERVKYIQRTKEARKFSKKNPKDISEYIGVDTATYRSYESRRAMPQEYIARFCEFTGVNERWLISGKGQIEANYVEKLEAVVKHHIASLQAVIPSE